MDDKPKRIRQYREAWRKEIGATRVYHELAQREANPERRAILGRMSQMENGHAEKWAARLRELGVEPGAYVESLAERSQRWLLMQTGTDTAVQRLETAEEQADGLYDEMLKNAQSDTERAELIETQRDEKAHARVLNEMVQPRQPIPALITSFVISTLAHFAVGASKVVMTGRSWVRSGLEMTFVGLGEATVTYVIGLLIAPAPK